MKKRGFMPRVEDLQAGSTTANHSPLPACGEGDTAQTKDGYAKARAFLFKHGRSVTMDMVPTIMELYVAEAENTRLKKLVSDKEPNGYPLWFNRAVAKCQRCDEEDLCRRHWEMAHADFKNCEEYVAAFIKELEATHE